jgi:hypothetical protein
MSFEVMMADGSRKIVEAESASQAIREAKAMAFLEGEDQPAISAVALE